MCNKCKARTGRSAGFSLIELMIALAVTMVIMVISARMLAASLAVRSRENTRVEAIADVQRALQTMSREIGNAGLGLTGNGLVNDDCEVTQIRVRSNLNAFCATDAACDNDTEDPGEDVVYTLINNTTGGDGDNQRLITRQDVNVSGSISALANRIDELDFTYVKADGTTTATPSEAQSVRITLEVTLLAVGTEGQAGYQPASRMQLRSEAVLRNLILNQ